MIRDTDRKDCDNARNQEKYTCNIKIYYVTTFRCVMWFSYRKKSQIVWLDCECLRRVLITNVHRRYWRSHPRPSIRSSPNHRLSLHLLKESP